MNLAQRKATREVKASIDTNDCIGGVIHTLLSLIPTVGVDLHTLCCMHTVSCSISRKIQRAGVKKVDLYNGIHDMYGQKSVLVCMSKSSAI